MSVYLDSGLADADSFGEVLARERVGVVGAFKHFFQGRQLGAGERGPVAARLLDGRRRAARFVLGFATRLGFGLVCTAPCKTQNGNNIQHCLSVSALPRPELSNAFNPQPVVGLNVISVNLKNMLLVLQRLDFDSNCSSDNFNNEKL